MFQNTVGILFFLQNLMILRITASGFPPISQSWFRHEPSNPCQADSTNSKSGLER
ncbi:hypothetical protein ACI1P2_12255 [Paenibacillus sp. p-8]